MTYLLFQRKLKSRLGLPDVYPQVNDFSWMIVEYYGPKGGGVAVEK